MSAAPYDPPAFAEAASRHLEDGETLYEQQRYDKAGYHFGLAVECFLKSKMLKGEHDSALEGKYRNHLPKIAQQFLRDFSVTDMMKSRIEQSNFMSSWHTDMRYASNNAVSAEMAHRWMQDARTLIGMMDDA